MKKFVAYLFIILILFGCSSIADLPNFQKSSFNNLEEGKKEFIELNDGTYIEGDITKENLGRVILIGKTGGVTINSIKYYYKNIVAFQEGNRYYRKTTYNDFAERIVKGKINIYRIHHNNNAPRDGGKSYHSYDLFYIQKGDKNIVSDYSNKLLEKLILDNASALAKYNEYMGLSKKQKRFRGETLINDVIRLYNGVK